MREQKKELKRKIFITLIFLLFSSLLTLRSFKKINAQNVSIYGSKLVSLEDILRESSLKLSTPLILLKTKYIEKELKRNLSLENVSINRRILPFGLQIIIQTRQPIAYGERISNGVKILGFIDKDGFFIDQKYSDKELQKEIPTRIFGWERNFSKTISRILNYSKNHKIKFDTINFSPSGYLTLEEVNLNKIILGNDSRILESQLQTISNIKNQLTDKRLFGKIDTIDLTDPQNPKIKVFKP